MKQIPLVIFILVIFLTWIGYWTILILFANDMLGNARQYSWNKRNQASLGSLNDQLVTAIPDDQVKNYHIILYWTTYFDANPIDRESPFKRLHNYFDHTLKKLKYCYQKYPKCLITTNRAYLKHSGALIFHWRDFKENDLPSTRNDNQMWTLYNLEPPFNVRRLPENDKVIFNLTATYMRDSEIYQPYGIIIPRKTPLSDSNPRLKIELSDKSKPIAWLVSNCDTPSDREGYVQQLSGFIEVDIYGRCGPFKCDDSNKDACYRNIEQNYLFYLSFENSLCPDYVTEKVFNVLRYDLVPVVYGGANYSHILPPNSYIDANQMRPDQLAQLLLSIVNDKDKYRSYFAWRKYYMVATVIDDYAYCKLCKRIADLQQHYSQNKQLNNTVNHNSMHNSYTTKQINSWFSESLCNVVKPKLFN